MDPMMMGMPPPDEMMPPGMLPPPGMTPPPGPMAAPPIAPPSVVPPPGMTPIGTPIEEEPLPPLRLGSVPPLWYSKPKRPKLTDIRDAAKREQADHRGRVDAAADARSRIAQDALPGHFADDIEEIKAGRMVLWRDLQLTGEHNLACTHIASMQIAAESLHLEPIDEEESTAKEDDVHWLFENWEIQHRRAGLGQLRWRLPDWAMKDGLIVSHVGLDPSNEDTGIRFRLIDPATAFPVWEGDRGLSHLYRVYEADAATVVGDFGDAEGKLEKKVMKIAKGGGDNKYDPRFTAEVIEYWDRNCRIISFADEEIDYREHGHARVPFVATACPWGDDSDSTVGLVGGSYGWSNTERLPNGERVAPDQSGGNSRGDRITRRYRPFLSQVFAAHDQSEAVMSRVATDLKNGPRYALQQSMLGAVDGPPDDIDRNTPGWAAIVSENDTPVLLAPTPPQLVQTAMMADAQNRTASGVPASLMGQNPAAQTPGTAVNALNAAGLERFAPVVEMVQDHLTDVFEWALVLQRDYMPILGSEGKRGSLRAPRRTRTGDAPAHEVTQEMLDRSGPRVRVLLHKKGIPDPSVVNSIVMLKNIQEISSEKVQGLLGETDPTREMKRIRMDQLQQVPEVAQAETLIQLNDMMKKAFDREDWVSFTVAQGRARYVMERIEEAQIQKAMRAASLLVPKPMGGPGMPGGGGMPGVDPGTMAGMPSEGLPPGVPVPPMPPDGNNIHYQGAAMPDFGIDPGHSGGRPGGS